MQLSARAPDSPASLRVPRRPGVSRGGVATLAGVLVLTGCGSGDPETQVRRAEAQVAQKKQALAESRDTFEQASEDFCQSSRTYVVALDRYGDILHSTDPTVGDVRDAGKELADPGEAALTAAETAVAANLEVAVAEQELADAKATLKLVKSGAKDASTGNGGTDTTSTPSPSPLAPVTTVQRVKAAESDFGAASDGVTDATPLVQAAQEFNAAAVALELSWMQLVVEAGCLTAEEEQQAKTAVEGYTRRLQQSLEQAGYYAGPINGVYGAGTAEAVKTLQRAHDLPVTGAVDKSTQAALQADLLELGGVAAQEAVASTAAVQQTLKLAGYWDGPVDGEWSPELTAAITELQQQLGVEQTGAVDAATVAALEDAVAEAGRALSGGRDGQPSDRPSDPPASSSTPPAPSPSGSSSDGKG